MELYTVLGDSIAWQYGGSEAHKKNLGSSGSGKQASPKEEFVLFRLSGCKYIPKILNYRKNLDLCDRGRTFVEFFHAHFLYWTVLCDTLQVNASPACSHPVSNYSVFFLDPPRWVP